VKICNYIPVKHDKRKKVTPTQIQKIKELRQKGYSYIAIAKRMQRHWTTIFKYMNPEYAKRVKLLQNKINKKRFKTDKKYREKQIAQRNKRNLKRIQEEPKYKDYVRCVTRRWRLKHKKYYANYRKNKRKQTLIRNKFKPVL